MIKRIAAIIAAAGCAAFIVSVVPEVAVGNSQNAGTIVASAGRIDTAPEAGIDTRTQRKITCTQGWPYYEKACLHDGRQSDGKAQMVRMIAIDHLTKSGQLQRPD